MQIGANPFFASLRQNGNSLSAKSEKRDLLSELSGNPNTKNEVCLAKQMADAKSVAIGLNSITRQPDETKKSMALARYQEITKQVQQLKKMLGGDPKYLAKELARLAKELKSVLKDFTDAVGTKGQIIETAIAATPSPANTNAANQTNDDGQSKAPQTEKSPDAVVEPIIDNLKSVEETFLKLEEILSKLNPHVDNLPTSAAQTQAPIIDTKKLEKAYAQSLLSPPFADFIKDVRKTISDMKFLMGLAKAGIEAQHKNDKETKKLFEEYDKDTQETLEVLDDFQQEQSKITFESGQMVSLSA